MALAPLISETDLADRNITIPGGVDVTAFIAAASAFVRDGAGSPILQTTSTVALTGWGEQLLDLPGQPIQSVATVTLDGDTVTDFKLANDRLWRARGWGDGCEPSVVVVTLTHGLPEVPADIVELVCNLASVGMSAAASETTVDPRVVMERIDDYSVQFAQGGEAVASAMELPSGTRRRLRGRFGGTAAVIEYR